MEPTVQQSLNILGKFLAYRSIPTLTPQALYEFCGAHRADILIVLGNSLPFTAELAAKLYRQGLCKKLLFSGGIGRATELLIKLSGFGGHISQTTPVSEAEILAQIAMNASVPKADIILEPDSTNTGENVLFSLALLKERRIPANQIIMIQDPLLQLRAYATFQAHLLPGIPLISYAPFIPCFDENLTLKLSPEISGLWDFSRYIELAAGEIMRLRDTQTGYGPNGKGFIAHVTIPKEAEAAFRVICEAYPEDIQ